MKYDRQLFFLYFLFSFFLLSCKMSQIWLKVVQKLFKAVNIFKYAVYLLSAIYGLCQERACHDFLFDR